MRLKALGIGLLLVLTVFSPTVSAYVGWDNGLAVFITYQDMEYDIGDDIVVTLHAFYAGEYYTPDEIALSIGEDEREIGLTEQDTGRYSGVITIADDDLDSDGDLPLEAYAMYEALIWDDYAYDYKYISTTAGTGFDIEFNVIDPSDMYPRPGQEIEISLQLTYRDSPVDPDQDTLYVYYSDPTGTETEIAVTRVGTGLFEGTMTIPAGLKESTEYQVYAEAENTHDSRTLYADTQQDASVNFYDIWANIIDVTPSQAQVDLYILGDDGAGIEGASVTLDWMYYDDAWDEMTGSDTGTTDAGGKASFTITYTDLGKDEGTVETSGRATSGGLTQLFEGMVYVRDSSGGGGSSGDGFEVELLSGDSLEPGASVTVEHLVTYDGEPIEDIDVYFYLVGDQQIYRFGSEQTDSEGKFDFPLNVPQLQDGELFDFMIAFYQVEMEFEWESTMVFLMIGDLDTGALLDEMLDPKVSISIDPFSVGEEIVVMVDHEDADGTGDVAIVVWGLGDVPDWEDVTNLDWESWTPSGIHFLNLEPCVWVDAHFEATIGCPTFLTTDSDMFFYAIIVLDEDDDFETGHAAKLTGVSPVPPNPAPASTITKPLAAEKVGGKVKIEGTASDDTSVERVEVRIDGGAWETASGTTIWKFEIDTTTLADGNHTVEVRSYDGQKYSDVQEVTFEVDQSVAPDDDDNGSPGFGAALMVLATVGAVLVTRRRRR